MRFVTLPRAYFYLAGHRLPRLSPKGQERLRMLSAWQALRRRGLTSIEASQVLEVSRATLYRWSLRVRQEGLRGLENRSRRPIRCRRRSWGAALVARVQLLRETYPGWGKDPLTTLLGREGRTTSMSTVGRILGYLKQRGYLHEPPRHGSRHRKHYVPRPFAIRKPHDYPVTAPGDLVQVDTMDVRPMPGLTYKHFTACDTVSRWNEIEVHSQATSTTAASFLEGVLHRMPFPIKAIQVDGGSEFRAAFERACQLRGVQLFALPPFSPKLNGRVERAHRTHLEGFYDFYEGELGLGPLNHALSRWQKVYNFVRPHRALDRRTPADYIRACYPQLTPKLSHMY
jgi:transposase InsO family protein